MWARFILGLGQFVTCDDLKWEFSSWYNLQRVGVHRSLTQPGTEAYRRWHERLLEYRAGDTPDFGAIWVTYLPDRYDRALSACGRAIYTASCRPSTDREHY